MRLSECPGYGIALYDDGGIAFLKTHPSPSSEFNCRVTFHPPDEGIWFTHIGKGFYPSNCRRDDDPIQRFWQMDPKEVQKLEPLIRERLEK